MNQEPVGLVGLGQMGLPMSIHLRDAGFEVTGYDIDPDRMRAFADAGGRAATSPRDVADHASIVITSLPSASALLDVLSGSEGVLESGRSDLVVVETSTLDLDSKERARRRVEEAGAVALDCPLSGTAVQAQTKDVVVLASGDPDAVDRCRDVFAGLARAYHDLGPFGEGSKMKYLANHLVAIHNVAAAEVLVLAMKAGMNPETALDVLTGGAGTSRMLEVRGPVMARASHAEAGMSGWVFQKDLEIIDRFARQLGCPVPLFAVSQQVYAAMISHGLGDLDTSAVCTVLERLAGLEERQEGASSVRGRKELP